MAFNKTKTSYFVCSFQNWIKKSTLKNQKFAIPCPRPLFCLKCKLSGIKPASTAELPTTVNHLDQKAKHSGEIMLSFCVYESILICRMVNFHFFFNGQNSISLYFFFKTQTWSQSVDAFCFSVLILTSLQTLVI